MQKKYLIIGGVLAFLVIVLGAVLIMGGGGNNQPQGEIELTWWKTFEESENVYDIIADYEKLHKNVTIKFVKKNINTYEQELVDAIASGRGPDIFSIHNDWLPKHIEKLAPMPDGMNERQYRETFVDVASSDFLLDGKIYAIPLAVDVLALYYNKDILNSAGIATPPATWTDMVQAVEKITRQTRPGEFSRSGVAMGTSANVNRAVDILLLLMLQNNTPFYNEDYTSAEFDRGEIIEDKTTGEWALQYYTQFADPSKTSYTWNSRSEFSIDAFTQGKLGMMLSYSYQIPVIRSKAPTLNWGVAAAPQAMLNGNKINFANYWGEAVSKSSINSTAAWDFVKYLSERETLQKYYDKHKLVSSRKDLVSGQFSDSEIGVFAENALSAKSVYKKDANFFETVFNSMIDAVILRHEDLDEALNNAVQQININLNPN